MQDLSGLFSYTKAQAVIAIDGQAGSGKSTLAKMMGDHLKIPYLNTGSMYRAITWWCIQLEDGCSDNGIISRSQLPEITVDAEGKEIFLDGNEVSVDLRSAEVQTMVSQVASLKYIRDYLVDVQRAWAADVGICIMEGRDIGSIVFPRAFFKVFLHADDEIRASRRPEEGQEVKRRDLSDSTRKHSPSLPAEDALMVDTSNMTSEEVFSFVMSMLHDKVELLGRSSSI